MPLPRTRQQVLDMYRTGKKVRDIAYTLGMSTQAVYQHLTRLRADGFLETEEQSA